MFQRVQSIYLLASIGMLAASFFIPFGTFSDGVHPIDLRSYGAKNVEGMYLNEPSNYFIYLVFTLVMVINLYALLSFRNRMLQLRLVKFSFLLLAGGFVLLSLYINGGWAAFPGMSFQPGIALFLPLGAILFNYLAARGVRKDEELVRSADRIR